MEIGFCVEQSMHALFEYSEDVNEITNNLTKAVSDEFCMISLFLQKLILGVTWRIDSWLLK